MMTREQMIQARWIADDRIKVAKMNTLLTGQTCLVVNDKVVPVALRKQPRSRKFKYRLTEFRLNR